MSEKREETGQMHFSSMIHGKRTVCIDLHAMVPFKIQNPNTKYKNTESKIQNPIPYSTTSQIGLRLN